jgi:signal peptide peptidase SppA
MTTLLPPRLTASLYNRPLALLPNWAWDFADDTADGIARPAPEVIDGVAIIPVRGVLFNSGAAAKRCSRGPSFWNATYGDIRRAFLAALDASDVQAIALLCDSPGGTVEGCFDLAELIYQARGAKPTHAILAESAYSAAYALASACDRISVPRTGGTGSVGVIAMHADLSGMLDEAGIKVTIIRYGERKAEGGPYEPLSDAALARMQADVDTLGELFVDTVARNRGLKASAVRAQQAGTFLGAAGVEAGLADAVAAPDAAFRALLGTFD